jgi:hypothetical protein
MMYLNLHRFQMGPDLRGDWMLFMWTHQVVKLLRFLVLLILSTFSSGANPQNAEGVEATPVGSSGVSIGELWLNIDKLDEVSCGGASIVAIPEVAPHEGKSRAFVEKSDKFVRHKKKLC